MAWVHFSAMIQRISVVEYKVYHTPLNDGYIRSWQIVTKMILLGEDLSYRLAKRASPILKFPNW